MRGNVIESSAQLAGIGAKNRMGGKEDHEPAAADHPHRSSVKGGGR